MAKKQENMKEKANKYENMKEMTNKQENMKEMAKKCRKMAKVAKKEQEKITEMAIRIVRDVYWQKVVKSERKKKVQMKVSLRKKQTVKECKIHFLQ